MKTIIPRGLLLSPLLGVVLAIPVHSAEREKEKTREITREHQADTSLKRVEKRAIEAPTGGKKTTATPATPKPVVPPAKANSATELCGEKGVSVTYAATFGKGKVTVTATGSHPTSGFKVRLGQTPIAVFPPEFVLNHERPTGITNPVVTPFTVSASFKSAEKPTSPVVVHDAKGKHTVVIN